MHGDLKTALWHIVEAKKRLQAVGMFETARDSPNDAMIQCLMDGTRRLGEASACVTQAENWLAEEGR